MNRPLTLHRILTGIAIVAVFVGLTLTSVRAAPEITDAAVRNHVEDELLYDPATPLNEILVQAEDGVVTLSGTVNNALAKERAARLAETVKGVQTVVNNIEVIPSIDRSDAAIRGDVESALLYDAATDSYQVDVTVDDNIVTLSGAVDSWTERQLAASTAKGVRGVTAVNNLLTVRRVEDRPAADIKAEVEGSLERDARVDAGLIDVEVTGDVVRLSGTVGSAAEKRRAYLDAWVTGVDEVEDEDLVVADWADEEFERTEPVTDSPDADIKLQVNEALLLNPRVRAFNVTATVEDGVVTLRGEVDSVQAKRTAAEVARNTIGVAAVKNRLRVQPDVDLTDADIATNIRRAFERDPYVERYEVLVRVVDGVAYLNGTVDTYFEKGQADEVASRANGVVRVENNISVDTMTEPLTYDPYLGDVYPYDYEWYDYRPTYTTKTDKQIEDDVASEFFWSPFVDGDDIEITVDDGVVHLTGEVDSWNEFYAARENAFEGGATWVDNDLVVQVD